jgi:HK97 gp10 family phage protein
MAEDGLTIEIQGLAELQAKLTDMSTRQADTAMRTALKAGAVIEQAAITERAPIKDGTGGILPDGALKNDIVIKIRRDDHGGMSATVGPDKYTAHVARWVEYGHRLVRGGVSRLLANGKARGPGSQTGEVAENPFIRPAWEASRQAVTTAITTTLAAEIEAAAARKGNS